ncbi:MAG TPA: hypothetical protein DCZ40_13470 [Lachnospiraceae bacterium]|nr:hypothetical protein [Lachnospiraceae bacterium]
MRSQQEFADFGKKGDIMNISYHYYTIKTLASKAGFVEEEAQLIAHYSQMVDDFLLSNRVIIKETPPSFFMDNNLAQKRKDGSWNFLPCPTGINMVKSVSHGYQRHTLAPFHFIPSKNLKEIENSSGFSRMDYRCVSAEEQNGLLIQEILQEAARDAKENRGKKSLMRLGMALHTYADTYAHCHFSGLHGYENEAVIQKAYSKVTKSEAVPAPERIAFKELPSIGHANVGTVPDICCYDIAYAMKSSEKSKLEDVVKRDNTEWFSRCSRRILDVLCGITGKPLFTEEEWQQLQAALTQAQYVKKDTEKILTESFCKVFPDIRYEYNKNGRLSMELSVENSEEIENNSMMMPGAWEAGIQKENREEMLKDAFSPEANSMRCGYNVYMEETTEDFFYYNELAYERVKQVAGEYVSQGTMENFCEMCRYDLQCMDR